MTHETYTCLICKRKFVYAENSRGTFYDWISMLVKHVEAHLNITFAEVEKHWLKLCQEKERGK